MKPGLALVLLLACALFSACGSVEDGLRLDPGPVQLSCSGSGPLAGSPPLQASFASLLPGTKLEIERSAPDAPVQLTLPQGLTGDVFAYDWKENAVGPGGPPGPRQCRAGWRYDGEFWRLLYLDAQWIAKAAQ